MIDEYVCPIYVCVIIGVGTWRDKPNDMSEETKNYLSQVEKRDMEMVSKHPSIYSVMC